jgi:hypothetical protein
MDPRPRRCRRLRHDGPGHRKLPGTQLHDAVTRYADAVALAASRLRCDPEDCGPGPLPWLPGIPEVVAGHPSWGPYLSARSRRASALADERAKRQAAAGQRGTPTSLQSTCGDSSRSGGRPSADPSTSGPSLDGHRTTTVRRRTTATSPTGSTPLRRGPAHLAGADRRVRGASRQPDRPVGEVPRRGAAQGSRRRADPRARRRSQAAAG